MELRIENHKNQLLREKANKIYSNKEVNNKRL